MTPSYQGRRVDKGFGCPPFVLGCTDVTGKARGGWDCPVDKSLKGPLNDPEVHREEPNGELQRC